MQSERLELGLGLKASAKGHDNVDQRKVMHVGIDRRMLTLITWHRNQSRDALTNPCLGLVVSQFKVKKMLNKKSSVLKLF